MGFVNKDRIRETSTTTGTGEYLLDGAPTGFQPFSTIGANSTCSFYATDGTNWESGIGTYVASPSRLQRTAILESSNAGAAVNWGAGTKTIRCGLPAALAYTPSLSKDVAGGAGDTTLTEVEAKKRILTFTGVLTGNRNIIVPATSWEWIVFNNTTGAFTLTVKTAAGSGKAVTQTQRATLYCDGTNVEHAFNDSAVISGFASGTRVIFQQTAAPTGWTKESSATYNDAALRLITGTVGTGGADAFSAHFGTGKTTGSHTLTAGQIPDHTHSAASVAFVDSGAAGTEYAAGAAGRGANAATAGAGLGGGSHDHTLTNFNIKFADCIIAAKN